VLVFGLDDATAMTALAAAMNSPCDASGAAHLPALVAGRASQAMPVGRAVTALRLEGVAPSVAPRKEALEDLLKAFGALGALDAAQSRTFWRGVRDVAPFAAAGPAGQRIVWRISTAPTKGAELARAIARQANAEVFYDWAGGLVWVALAPTDDAGAGAVRAAAAACGGHAMLVRAPAALRAAVEVFPPQDASLAALTRRVKESFDPTGVLNPGRMWAGV
jgi:glycolate oxidase FAD binding subunit